MNVEQLYLDIAKRLEKILTVEAVIEDERWIVAEEITELSEKGESYKRQTEILGVAPTFVSDAAKIWAKYGGMPKAQRPNYTEARKSVNPTRAPLYQYSCVFKTMLRQYEPTAVELLASDPRSWERLKAKVEKRIERSSRSREKIAA